LGGRFRRSLLGQTKIENLHAVIASDENVVGLQVAMHNSFFMRGRESLGDFKGVFGRLAARECSGRQHLAQRLPFQKFRNQLAHVALLANIKDGENVGMVQSAQDSGFVLKAQKTVGIARNRRRQDFDRDRAIEPGIAGAVDFSHAAGTDRQLNFIRSKPGARGQRHAWVHYKRNNSREMLSVNW
jgi:hypothetical protein